MPETPEICALSSDQIVATLLKLISENTARIESLERTAILVRAAQIVESLTNKELVIVIRDGTLDNVIPAPDGGYVLLDYDLLENDLGVVVDQINDKKLILEDKENLFTEAQKTAIQEYIDEAEGKFDNDEELPKSAVPAEPTAPAAPAESPDPTTPNSGAE